MAKTKITAHTGCMGTPQNSLEALEAAVRIKAEICEVDVSALSDGTPVLKHDKVFPTDVGLVRLSEVFEFIKNKNILVNLDIKDMSVLKKVELLAEQYGIEHCIFLTGITEREAIKLKDTGIRIKLKCYLNHDLKSSLVKPDYEVYLDKLIGTIKELGCIGLNSHYRFCTQKAVQKIHDAGLQVSVWTVDDLENMKKLIEMGVDNITTRNPGLIID